MFVCELLGSFVTVAQAEPNAKRWRRSRDRGLPVLWLATAQNLTLLALCGSTLFLVLIVLLVVDA
jgi:hypothetical protein